MKLHSLIGPLAIICKTAAASMLGESACQPDPDAINKIVEEFKTQVGFKLDPCIITGAPPFLAYKNYRQSQSANADKLTDPNSLFYAGPSDPNPKDLREACLTEIDLGDFGYFLTCNQSLAMQFNNGFKEPQNYEDEVANLELICKLGQMTSRNGEHNSFAACCDYWLGHASKLNIPFSMKLLSEMFRKTNNTALEKQFKDLTKHYGEQTHSLDDWQEMLSKTKFKEAKAFLDHLTEIQKEDEASPAQHRVYNCNGEVSVHYGIFGHETGAAFSIELDPKFKGLPYCLKDDEPDDETDQMECTQ